MAERGPQHLERLAVGDEHERLLPRVAPPRRLRQQPLEARIRRRPSPAPARAARARPGRARRAQRGAGRERAADAVDLLASRHRIRRGGVRAPSLRRPRAAASPAASSSVDRHADARRQPADVHAARRARARRQRRARRQPRLEAHVLGELLGPQQLQQPEEAVRVVFERRRAQQQHMAAERGDRRHGAPRRLAGMARRPPQPLRFVHHQEIDAGGHRLRGELRIGRSASRAR